MKIDDFYFIWRLNICSKYNKNPYESYIISNDTNKIIIQLQSKRLFTINN